MAANLIEINYAFRHNSLETDHLEFSTDFIVCGHLCTYWCFTVFYIDFINFDFKILNSDLRIQILKSPFHPLQKLSLGAHNLWMS